MKKSYLDRTKTICNTILGSYLTTTILTFEEMAVYQKKLEEWLSSVTTCFLNSPYFVKEEYVECIYYIHNTKDEIYKSYFQRYE